MSKQLLIASNNAALAAVVASDCRTLGAEVVTTRADFEAIAARLRAAPVQPDLVVVDPDEGCQQLADTLHRLFETTDAPIPVISLSVQSESSTLEGDGGDMRRVIKGKGLWSRLRPVLLGLLEAGGPGPCGGPANESEDEEPVTRLVPKVLCVDDDFEFAQALAMRLNSYGASVVQASSGVEGFWAALKERPDLIITDYVMPEGQADYLLRRLKEHTLTRDIPVIVLTGRDFSGRHTCHKDGCLERQLHNLGATCVLVKPLEPAAFLAAVEQCLERSWADTCAPEQSEAED